MRADVAPMAAPSPARITRDTTASELVAWLGDTRLLAQGDVAAAAAAILRNRMFASAKRHANVWWSAISVLKTDDSVATSPPHVIALRSFLWDDSSFVGHHNNYIALLAKRFSDLSGTGHSHRGALAAIELHATVLPDWVESTRATKASKMMLTMWLTQTLSGLADDDIAEWVFHLEDGRSEGVLRDAVLGAVLAKLASDVDRTMAFMQSHPGTMDALIAEERPSNMSAQVTQLFASMEAAVEPLPKWRGMMRKVMTPKEFRRRQDEMTPERLALLLDNFQPPELKRLLHDAVKERATNRYSAMWQAFVMRHHVISHKLPFPSSTDARHWLGDRSISGPMSPCTLEEMAREWWKGTVDDDDTDRERFDPRGRPRKRFDPWGRPLGSLTRLRSERSRSPYPSNRKRSRSPDPPNRQ